MTKVLHFQCCVCVCVRALFHPFAATATESKWVWSTLILKVVRHPRTQVLDCQLKLYRCIIYELVSFWTVCRYLSAPRMWLTVSLKLFTWVRSRVQWIDFCWSLNRSKGASLLQWLNVTLSTTWDLVGLLHLHLPLWNDLETLWIFSIFGFFFFVFGSSTPSFFFPPSAAGQRKHKRTSFIVSASCHHGHSGKLDECVPVL